MDTREKNKRTRSPRFHVSSSRHHRSSTRRRSPQGGSYLLLLLCIDCPMLLYTSRVGQRRRRRQKIKIKKMFHVRKKNKPCSACAARLLLLFRRGGKGVGTSCCLLVCVMSRSGVERTFLVCGENARVTPTASKCMKKVSFMYTTSVSGNVRTVCVEKWLQQWSLYFRIEVCIADFGRRSERLRESR